MKNHFGLALLLLTTTSSVYATKARMQALGQDVDRGSFYLKDTRTVFRNAAHINDFNNYILTEWGQSAVAEDTSSAPGAEGGFFTTMGALNYGVYLGSDLDSQNDVRNGGNYAGTATAVGATSFVDRDNEVDLFFGGDSGVKWGARLHYSSSKNETTFESKQSSMGLGLGASMGDLEAYANIGIKDESEGAAVAGDKWEADTGINAGLSYQMKGYTYFVNYDKIGAKYTANGAAAVETSRGLLTVGVGHEEELSSTARIIMDLKYQNQISEDKTTVTTEVTTSTLPLTIGFEADALSWITLRGSISQNIVLSSSETKGTNTLKSTVNNTTNIEAGMTLNFGKVLLDGVIGNTGTNGSAIGTESGVLSLDRLSTRVAMHYWF